MICVDLKEISYGFRGNVPVLNKINMMVPKGSIYGFLGPNGAGKTTTLRLLLGLLKKQSGSIHIFNVPFEENRIEILKQTGSMIESPSLYGHLTAFENLNIIGKIHNCSKERINEVLELVGLSNTGKKKSGQFSLGMKQRLGIAIAMLNKPSLLILDEPTNGLDPNGIHEIRELFKRLNSEFGITILISSHLLSEIEKLVSHVGIIHNGTMLFQGTLADLVMQKHKVSGVVLKTNNMDKSIEILKSNNCNPLIQNEEIFISFKDNDHVASMNRLLNESGIKVYEVTPIKNDLENIFMNLVSN